MEFRKVNKVPCVMAIGYIHIIGRLTTILVVKTRTAVHWLKKGNIGLLKVNGLGKKIDLAGEAKKEQKSNEKRIVKDWL